MLGADTEGMTTDSRLASSFTQARNYYPGRRAPVRLVVLHTIEAPETEGRAEWCAQYFAGPNAPIASAHYCLTPETRVLTRDLHWVSIGELSEGSLLWGTQESAEGLKAGRTYQPTEITKYATRKAPCFRIVMSDGRSVICSSDHKWLAKYPKGQVPWFWESAERIRVGTRIMAPLDVWDTASTLDSAWLAGIFDGEGCASRGNKNRALTFAQKDGYVLEKAKRVLNDMSIPYRLDTPRSTGVTVVRISGVRNILRTLGELQPIRLVKGREDFIAGRALKSRSYPSELTVTSIEYVGERDVVSIETSTHTFFAEGMVSHNCVDPDSITQGVREAHTAWAAPGANADGIQIEQAGYAGQTASQWDDAPSKALLDRTARLVADLCVRHNLPIRHLTNDQLKAGERGVIGHRQASQVYRLSDHTDPGDNFPWDKVIAQAKMYATGAKPVITSKPATGTKIAEDGVLGPKTVKALQKAVGTVQDGVIGGRKTASQTVTALQKLLNTKSGAKLSVDGYMGPATTTALQKYVGSTPDGLLGPKTILALQRKLNSGKF